MKPKYCFYATLLYSFQSYLDRAEIYQKYYGFSKNPPYSEVEWDEKMFKELIDKINRVPFENESADKGTAFNEVIDCLIMNKPSTHGKITWLRSNKETGIIEFKFNNYDFLFPIPLCLEFAKYFQGALTQQRVTGTIGTCYGLVEVYGVIDELLPFSIHDIKTTSKYETFKYRKNWQHIVYPYCTGITDFEYNITDFKDTYTEKYVFDKTTDSERLKLHCEQFIEFIEQNKKLITDKKVFNLTN